MNKRSLLKQIPPAFLLLAASASLHAQTLTPFNTAVRNYIYIGKPGLNADATTIALYSSSDPAQSGGGFGSGTPLSFVNSAPAQSINAVGINNLDGYAYGMEYLYTGPASATARLYRIDANAQAEALGTLNGPTAADAGRAIQYSFVNTASGMVDGKGDYWFSAYTFTDMTPPLDGSKADVFLARVPGVASLSSGSVITPEYFKLDISDPILQTGYTNFMSQVAALSANGLPVTDADGGWQDMDLNPADDLFYSYIAFPSAPTNPSAPYPKPPLNSYLVKINNTVVPWKVELINTTPNTNPNREENGLYFDAGGGLWALFTDGQYALVDPVSGEVLFLTPSSMPTANGNNMRGDFGTNTPVTPLPIALKSFTARAMPTGNVLSWTFADSKDLAGLRIERSSDGQSFSSLAALIPSGAEEYNWTDAAPFARSYYRLQFREQSGKSTYSPVVPVFRSAGDEEVRLFPTLVTDQLSIAFSKPQIRVRITDVNGRQLFEQSCSQEGRGVASLALPALPSGLLLVSVYDAESGALLRSGRILRK